MFQATRVTSLALQLQRGRDDMRSDEQLQANLATERHGIGGMI